MLTPDGVFTYANAGHGPAIGYIDGKIQHLDSHRTPLGIDFPAGEEPTQSTIQLAHGDRLFLASDGVNESQAPDGQQFSNTPIETAVTDASQTADQVIESLNQKLTVHRRGHPVEDDVTMLCVDRV